MFRIKNKATVKLTEIKIDNINFNELGLYIEKDYIFNLPPLIEEFEPIYIPGRDGRVDEHKRWLNREFSVSFKMEDSVNYYDKVFHIQDVLDSKIGKVITVNGDNYGYKLNKYSITGQNRGIGSNAMVFNFICEPFMHDINGNVLERR